MSMDKSLKSVLVIGFNSRPVVYSLAQVGYEVYAVDFFGDLDLFPLVKDCKIVVKELGSDYECAKSAYHEFIADFSIELINKHEYFDYIVITSGLDDDLKERQKIIDRIKDIKKKVIYANNSNESMKNARDIEKIYSFLQSNDFRIPLTIPLKKYLKNIDKENFPIILKKKKGSGGINVYKISGEKNLSFVLRTLKALKYDQSEWHIQEYIEGIPVSCTTISNGKEAIIISINRQVIGEKFLNSPNEFMYCGNIVPANLYKNEEILIEAMVKALCKKYGLLGINGFDFVIRDHHPYLMEINPRIPGSLQASEYALNLNILDLHLKCFETDGWMKVKEKLSNKEFSYFATKFIFFSPASIERDIIEKINKLEHIHDKTDPDSRITKGTPICSVLYKGKSLSESYFGGLKIIDKIKKII
ncbi:MAG: ATP-grasp domain-containing protein, partial [Promethearchaeota archaeon]